MSTDAPPQDAARPPEGAVALMRMVDFRIPMPWLLTGFLVGVGALVGMYYQLQNVTEALRDMQVTLKANNTSLVQLAAEQALLKYRIDKLEAHQPR
jgi:hypothetical protein